MNADEPRWLKGREVISDVQRGIDPCLRGRVDHVLLDRLLIALVPNKDDMAATFRRCIIVNHPNGHVGQIDYSLGDLLVDRCDKSVVREYLGDQIVGDPVRAMLWMRKLAYSDLRYFVQRLAADSGNAGECAIVAPYLLDPLEHGLYGLRGVGYCWGNCGHDDSLE